MQKLVAEIAQEFCGKPHGSTDLFKERVFIQGESVDHFVPLSYLIKKSQPNIKSVDDLLSVGYVMSSLDFLDLPLFPAWWQKQFNKKLTQK